MKKLQTDYISWKMVKAKKTKQTIAFNLTRNNHTGWNRKTPQGALEAIMLCITTAFTHQREGIQKCINGFFVALFSQANIFASHLDIKKSQSMVLPRLLDNCGRIRQHKHTLWWTVAVLKRASSTQPLSPFCWAKRAKAFTSARLYTSPRTRIIDKGSTYSQSQL